MIQDRPDWFALRTDRLSPWRTVRVPEEHVEEFLLEVIGTLAHAERRVVFLADYAPFADALPRLARLARERAWREVNGWELVAILESAVGVELGHETFLPPPFNALDAGVRRFLYSAILIANASVALEADPTACDAVGVPAVDLRALPVKLKALLPAARSEFARFAGPFAEAELIRRARDHHGEIGLNVAFLRLSVEALRHLGESADLQATQDEALDRLVHAALARKGTAGRIRCIEPGASRDEVKGYVVSFLGGSLPPEWLGLDPFEALARGASGEFNVVTLATERNIVDALRRQEVRERDRERITIELKRDEDTPAIDPIETTVCDTNTARLADWREMKEALCATPEGRRVFDTIPDTVEADKTDLAKRLGMSPRTFGRLIKRLGL